MQFVRATTAAALLLLFGAIVPAYAQHEKENEKEAKPEKQAAQQQPKQERAQQAKQQKPKQERAQQAKQQKPKQERAQQTKQQQPKQEHAQQTKRQQPQQAQRSEQGQPQHTRQQAVAWQQQRGWQQGGGWQAHSTWQQDRSQRWDRDHRTWAQRGGYGGYFIPEAQFNVDFGIGHGFRMHGIPTIYMGYPRFSYGGFSFLLVDPYPGSWAENWYDTDDLYIGFDNGYYLYDRRYPRMGLAITVAL